MISFFPIASHTPCRLLRKKSETKNLARVRTYSRIRLRVTLFYFSNGSCFVVSEKKKKKRKKKKEKKRKRERKKDKAKKEKAFLKTLCVCVCV